MNPENNINSNNPSSFLSDDLKTKNHQKISDKFDFSIIGKIDLAEAEKIASEEVVFLTEEDLIEGLENFELVPIKNNKDESKKPEKNISVVDTPISDDELIFKNEIDHKKDDDFIHLQKELEEINHGFKESLQTSNSAIENNKPIITEQENISEDILINENDKEIKSNIEFSAILLNQTVSDNKIDISENDLIIDKNNTKSNADDDLIIENREKEIDLDSIDEISTADIIETEIQDNLNEELPVLKENFTIKINEETLDSQLSSILTVESNYKTDIKSLEKYNDIRIDSKCRFIDDQYLNKPYVDDGVSYNEDPLTERLVKMIEVADGKLELLDVSSIENEYLNYILEDYTLYNAEKFGTAFKEEVLYIDSDFEFIDNAIIRDDFSKYIHEIDDYFGSEEFLIQSEISEILGLIPEENEYIEEKLFGDYYKRYDLDNEIDFIKPEIDFFRSNYTGLKNLNYFMENDDSILDSEKKSIEEDISSPNAIVFEEEISEIEEILRMNYGIKVNEITEDKQKPDEYKSAEEITNITDRIIILEDKEKLNKLASEYPEKHENLIKLLSYLDGLFEKLPEEVIRKFADSEYFELYTKVLKEIGV